MLPESAQEIVGPTFIFHPSDPSPIGITYDAMRARIVCTSLDKFLNLEAGEDDDEAPKKELTLLERVPNHTSQVWVVTRVAGSSSINLRTGAGEGKFLACDKHGLVSADREARGMEESWMPIILPDGMVAFESVYGRYLSMDEVAGGTLQLRGDSDEIGFNERFHVYGGKTCMLSFTWRFKK